MPWSGQRWSEVGARVERGWSEDQARVQWRVEKVAQTLGILYALPRRFLALPPLHLQRTKTRRGGEVGGRVEWGGEGWNGWRGWVKVMRGWIEDGARVERRWNEGWSVEKVAKKWYQIEGYVMIVVFIQIICVIHCLGFSPSLFTSPQLFLLPALLHPSTFPSTPNTFVPVPKKMLGAESVERSEQGWKAERFKKQRELHEVGVMGRITMKGWEVGRSERQMDGEKHYIYWTGASNSSWLRSYLSSRFFSKVLWGSVEVVFFLFSFIFCMCCKDQIYNVCLLFSTCFQCSLEQFS